MPWSELWKTLLIAGLGFLGGLLAEPVRMAITDRVKRRQMRRAMYWDAYRSYWDLVQFVYKGRNADVSGKEARSAMQRYVRDDLLEHYHKTEPGSLYRLTEFRELENFYSHLRNLKRCSFPTGKDYEMYMRDILNLFDYYVRSGRFNRRTLYGFGDRDMRKHWDNPQMRYSADSFEELL
jgi:hypothetical protein